MDIVEISRSTEFAVVGITAAVIVPTALSNAEAAPGSFQVGSDVLRALESALAAGLRRLAPDSSPAMEAAESSCEQPRPALRSIPTRPDFGARAGRVHTALTEREREVLCLVAGGASNRAIASQLVISPKTASVHVSRILTKLNATSRTEAAALAHASGLVRTGDLAGPFAVNA